MDLYELFNKHNIKIEKDIFDYGFIILKNYCLVISLSLIFSLWAQTSLEMIIFFFSFLFLRRYWGGYHFKHSLYCNIFSTMILIFLPVYIKYYFSLNWALLIIINCLSMISYLSIGPIDHPNKRISQSEKEIFKIKGTKTLIILLIFELTFKVLQIDIVSKSIFFALLCALISQIVVLLKNFIFKYC